MGVLVCRGFLPPQSAVRRGIGIALRLALPRMSIVGPLQPTKSGARAGAAGSASNNHMCAQTRLGSTSTLHSSSRSKQRQCCKHWALRTASQAISGKGIMPPQRSLKHLWYRHGGLWHRHAALQARKVQTNAALSQPSQLTHRRDRQARLHLSALSALSAAWSPWGADLHTKHCMGRGVRDAHVRLARAPRTCPGALSSPPACRQCGP